MKKWEGRPREGTALRRGPEARLELDVIVVSGVQSWGVGAGRWWEIGCVGPASLRDEFRA